MLTQPKVLMLSSDVVESGVLDEILSEHVILRTVRDLPELETALVRDDYDAMLCGWSFHQGCWNHALRRIRQWCPDLPVIIFCGHAGEREWIEVLQAGGFDMLNTPYLQSTVLPTLEHAVASHETRRFHKARQLTPVAS